MTTNLTITGYSTALFSTWYFVREYGILFDCGDGATTALMQKSRRIKHVFVSHADRDHLAGLLQFNQLNGRDELTIYYPKDCGSFSALAEFTSRFDPHTTGTRWVPLDRDQEVQVRQDVIVRAVENNHVKTANDQVKSLSYFVDSVARKLKPEFVGLPGSAIGALRKERGNDAITHEVRTTPLAFSADTPIELDGRYNTVQTLIHEATFLTEAEIEPDNPKRNKHSSLDQVMRMVAGSNIKRLILGHFSSRYDNEEIDAAVVSEIERNQISIPVFVVHPGETVSDVLRSVPA